MKKYLIFGLAAVVVFSVSAVLAAKPDLTRQLVEVKPSGGQAAIAIPAHAVEVTPGVFSLGTATDVDGRVVQGFLFVDNRKENAKPSWAGKKGGEEKCYDFLAKGARWKETEQYVTGDGIDAALTEKSLNVWDTEVLFDVFGPVNTILQTDGADTVSPDGKNEVEFKNIGDNSTIAYTIVWGIFSGPPFARELVEWDAVFNTAYPFGDADVDSSVMDYQNIATHEFGHAAGLGHPDDSCTEETMYRYADYGETKKRDLEAGDIIGIQELYK